VFAGSAAWWSDPRRRRGRAARAALDAAAARHQHRLGRDDPRLRGLAARRADAIATRAVP
jgi:hypothetical protein